MKRLKTTLIVSVACLALSAAHVSAQQTATKITFSGSATVAGTIELLFYAPPAQPCNTYINCPIVCSVTVDCPPGPPDLVFLSQLVSGLQANCPTLQVFAQSGPISPLELVIYDPSGTLECCIRTTESIGCGPFGESDVNLSPSCSVNNICNGVPCDEILPHTGGMQITKQEVLMKESEITITGTALAPDQLGLIIHAPSSASCAQYINCLNIAVCQPNFANCLPGDDGATVAAALAAAVNTGCGAFGTASAAGNVLTYTSPFDFGCCLVGFTETFPCGNGVPLGGACTVSNVCNGVACDELQPHTGGLQFGEVAPACAVNCPAGDLQGVGHGSNRSVDLTQDGLVDLADLAEFSLAYSGASTNLCADYNCNGFTMLDLSDLASFAIFYASPTDPHVNHSGVQGVCSP